MNPAPAGKRPTVYLDMNAIKVMARAASRPEFPDAAFVYSSEHFTEIQRGNTLFILDSLNALQAFEVCVTLNDRFQPTDHATFQRHENLKDRYDEHVRLVASDAQNLAAMHSLVATMRGANIAAKTLQAIADLPTYILPPDQIAYHPDVVAETERVAAQLLDTLRPKIHQLPSLDRIRGQLGSKEAETGNLDAKDVIPEIWKHISAQMPSVTIEQAFGKVPPAYLADKHWTLPRAIAHCHSMLNIVGYEPDLGLSHETKTANILSDAAHIANAAYCDGLVTGDKPMAAKARVIYAFLGVGTLVATLEEAKHSGPSKRKARP